MVRFRLRTKRSKTKKTTVDRAREHSGNLGGARMYRGRLVIGSVEKKNRNRKATRAMADMNKFIDDWELVDIPLCGANFTWSNGQEVPTRSRIDRFLLNKRWNRIGGQAGGTRPVVSGRSDR
ncbi:hypothetical protein BVC80_315g2 [Macleaya cordata]|uniref:Endonuclease/exonuclease/phosphatase n=1 Tax=Macleaya cordata TaxID=56857 RepID=A0A200Q5Y6_MACCD|nr:hypothetical protein BVC80_315g2 [Macleaya cordata]